MIVHRHTGRQQITATHCHQVTHKHNHTRSQSHTPSLKTADGHTETSLPNHTNTVTQSPTPTASHRVSLFFTQSHWLELGWPVNLTTQPLHTATYTKANAVTQRHHIYTRSHSIYSWPLNPDTGQPQALSCLESRTPS